MLIFSGLYSYAVRMCLEVIFLPVIMIDFYIFTHTIFASVASGQCLDQVFTGSGVLFRELGWGCTKITNFIHEQSNSTEQICYQK